MRSTLIALAFIGLSFGACTNNKPAVKNKLYKYVCIMHPGIGSDKPGVCAKCGMQLVERDADK